LNFKNCYLQRKIKPFEVILQVFARILAQYPINYLIKLCLKELFNNQCAYCGKNSPLTLDHFVPSSKGGPDCLGNLVPACLSCNSSKQDRNPEEWYKSQRFHSKQH
jgi:5-methylcytosine-specific restriction endonuclease McrA